MTDLKTVLQNLSPALGEHVPSHDEDFMTESQKLIWYTYSAQKKIRTGMMDQLDALKTIDMLAGIYLVCQLRLIKIGEILDDHACKELKLLMDGVIKHSNPILDKPVKAIRDNPYRLMKWVESTLNQLTITLKENEKETLDKYNTLSNVYNELVSLRLKV